MTGGWKVDDAARVRTLREFGLLDSPAEKAFDQIAHAAAAICDTPVALVTLLDSDRQVFKAHHGTELTGTPIEIALCRHVFEAGEAIVIPDLAEDDRTRDNPLVTGDPLVRFYAGYPLIVDGHAFGTLCVLDFEPHPDGLAPHQTRGLAALALEVRELMEQRRPA